MKKIVVNLLILIGLSLSSAYSQNLIPPIQNFTPNDYNASRQNWDIDLDTNGILYVANNEGLLVFDGLQWSKYSLDGNPIIRSVFVYEDKIFTGSYQEFGFWSPDEFGKLIYTSLIPKLDGEIRASEEFWEIEEYQGDIYFRSFGAVYRYDGERVNLISNMITNAMEKFDGKLLFASRREGIYSIAENGEMEQFLMDETFQNNSIIELFRLENTLYIGTRDQVFSYEQGSLRNFEDGRVNRLIEDYELNHINALNNKTLLFGTIKNGLIHYDLEKKTFNILNRGNGLQNNTVLGIAKNRGRVWLSLDKGVDVVDLDTAVNFYTDASGEVGAVYDIQQFKGFTYLATNTGIYRLNDSGLQQIEEAEGHTWNLEVINNTLYANHNTGVFEIEENRLKTVDNRTGSFMISEIPEDDLERILIAHYTGFSIYNKNTDELREVDSINFPIKQFVFEEPHIVWAAHPYEGVYRVIFDDDYEVEQLDKILPLKKGFRNFRPSIYEINNQIVLYLGNEWFRYDPFKEEFVDFEEFEDLDNHRLLEHHEDKLVFVNELDNSVLFTDLHGYEISLPEVNFQARAVKANENVLGINDSIFLMTLNDGFAEINIKKIEEDSRSDAESDLMIRSIKNDKKHFELKDAIELPFNQSRNIIVQAGMPNSRGAGLQYKLSGNDTLTGSTTDGNINLRNLSHGSYILSLWSPNANMQDGISYEFSVLPPWYLSSWMKFIYLILFLLAIGLVFWFNKRKLRKHQKRLEQRFEVEHKERLAKIEKDRLIQEIDLKRKELANTTLMAAKKNEILMEIQNELNKDKIKFSDQFKIKHISNKINKAVKSKDEWKVFETNFNEVHEDFFRDVLETYPDLTNKDLKLCSYLKMNLSSKEIAPLMGISVRGVEVHRYRLRKKMDLDSGTNLTKFLIKKF